MKGKFVQHLGTGIIYKILKSDHSGYARLKDIETGEELVDEDIHCVGSPRDQHGKDYVYVAEPQKKSEYYSVF